MSHDIEVAMMKQRHADLEVSVTQWRIMIENSIRSAIISIQEGDEDEAIAMLKCILGEDNADSTPT